jgi:hypothetical protein
MRGRRHRGGHESSCLGRLRSGIMCLCIGIGESSTGYARVPRVAICGRVCKYSTRAGEGSLAASTSFAQQRLTRPQPSTHQYLVPWGYLPHVESCVTLLRYRMACFYWLTDKTSQDKTSARRRTGQSSRTHIPGNSRQDMTFGDRRRAPGPLRLTMGGLAEVSYSRDIPALSLCIKQVEGDDNHEGYRHHIR